MVVEHTEALEYDLMTTTSFTLDDLGERLSFRALSSFVKRLPKTSETWQELNPKYAEFATWESSAIIPQLLATISDQMNWLMWLYSSTKSIKKQPKPKPLKRPGVKETTKRYGKDPIPISEFNDWWDNN